MTLTLSNHQHRISPAIVEPPPEHVFTMLYIASMRHYGDIHELQGSYASVTNHPHPVHMYALRELRDEIITAWHSGEAATMNINHVTTLFGLMDAFETVGLNRFPGDRREQRKACRLADPEFLRTITQGRAWAKKITLHQPDGRTFEIG